MRSEGLTCRESDESVPLGSTPLPPPSARSGRGRVWITLLMTGCMDYRHHHPLHAHRVYSLQAVERPPQPPCDDDGKPGDDDGNPYTPSPLSCLQGVHTPPSTPSLDIPATHHIYYLYPYQGGMGQITNEDKGNNYDHRNAACSRRRDNC